MYIDGLVYATASANYSDPYTIQDEQTFKISGVKAEYLHHYLC